MNKGEAYTRIYDAMIRLGEAADKLREVQQDVVCQSNLPPEAMASLPGIINDINDTAVGLDLSFGLIGEAFRVKAGV